MYVPGLCEDLKDIRRTLAEALAHFGGMADGPVWSGDLTNNLDPSVRAMILTSLEGKIVTLDTWLNNPTWTDSETMTLMLFVENWEAELLAIERLRNRYPNEPMADLAKIPQTGRPIPALDVPKRG